MYYRILPQLKNAIAARRDKIVIPFSKMDFAVLQALVNGGYVKSAEKETVGRKSMIVARVAHVDKKSVFTDFKIVSKPSRHVYRDYRNIRPVKQGHGLAVISTSKGVMTDRDARKQKVGGEYLFEVW